MIAAPCLGQSNSASDVGRVITQVRANLAGYRALLPNLICKEQIVSRSYQKDKLKREMQIEANLRMVHSTDNNIPTGLTETREILSVDGKPTSQEPGDIPLLMSDLFSNQDPGMFSEERSACRSYSLEGELQPKQTKLLVLVIHKAENIAVVGVDCKVATPQAVTRLYLDPATKQILRIEWPLQPRKLLGKEAQNLGTRVLNGWEVAYAEVKIDKDSYLLPVRARGVLEEPNHRSRATFDATFTDYHRFGSEVILVPNEETGKQPN